MENSVCFIGHRKINDTPQLRNRLHIIISELIEKGAVNFIFGDHSQFNELCYETVTNLKENYPKIKRIHFRNNYEDADEYTLQFLTMGYEESICPCGIGKAGRAGYIERNRAMICESVFCVFYYDENYIPDRKNKTRDYIRDRDVKPKSGTALAFNYAKSKNKDIINCFE